MSRASTLKAFVAASAKASGPPTIEEVSRELGVSRTATRDRLMSCVEAGLLEKRDGQQRGFVLTDAGYRIAMTRL